MIKNGLFLCSIGLLIILYSANLNTGQYNLLNMVTGIVFVASGGFFFVKGKRKAEKEEKKQGDSHGNR